MNRLLTLLIFLALIACNDKKTPVDYAPESLCEQSYSDSTGNAKLKFWFVNSDIATDSTVLRKEILTLANEVSREMRKGKTNLLMYFIYQNKTLDCNRIKNTPIEEFPELLAYALDKLPKAVVTGQTKYGDTVLIGYPDKRGVLNPLLSEKWLPEKN